MDILNKQSNSIFKEVSEKSRIVDVVSFYLGGNNLVRKGKIYLAICPFHHDTHPSMRVDPERNTYKCFACGAGGDSIKFVEQYAHLSPFDALKKVAEICAIPLPDSVSQRVILDPLKEKYAKELNALIDLRKYYQLSLTSLDGIPCQQYLQDRAIPKEVIEHFELGYANDNPEESISKLRGMGHEINTLIRAGILGKSKDLTDNYQHRLMFPIEDNYGHLVAFSGRVLSKEQTGGKYVNYQETALFHKNEVLYHFAKAKEDAKRKGYIYVVEGFMDVIAVVRAGIYAVCALMGTALTKEHAQAFKKLGVEVRLCLDSDEPGQVGEERACQILLEYGVPFSIVRCFKNGKDADDVLTKGGKDVLLRQLNRTYDPFLFFFRRTLKDRNMLTDSKEILDFLKKAAPYYEALDEVSKDKDIQWVEKLCSLNHETILSVLTNSTKSLKNKTEQKRTDAPFRYERDYISSRYSRRNKQTILEPIPCQMGDKYLQGSNVQQLYELASMQAKISSFSNRLLRTECDIISTLPHSYDAYRQFQEARTMICYTPFYYLANLIGNEYIKHPGTKEPFTPYDYESLITQVKALSPHHIKEEEEDPLGLGDDLFEEEDIDSESTLSDDEIEFLLKVIDIIRHFSPDCYDKDNLKNALVLHPLYVRYQYLQDKKEKASDKKLSREDNAEMAKLKFDIRKNNGTF